MIIRVLELHSVIMALILIIDQKSDGDLDLFKVDEEFSRDLEEGFRKLAKKVNIVLEEHQ